MLVRDERVRMLAAETQPHINDQRAEEVYKVCASAFPLPPAPWLLTYLHDSGWNGLNEPVASHDMQVSRSDTASSCSCG